MRRWRQLAMKLALGASLLALMLGWGCGEGGTADRPAAAGQVRGHVVEVVARNIAEVETLRLRDDAGEIWTFTSRGFAGFTPSHLREHRLLGQPVVVFYVEEGDSLVAVDITD